MSMADFGMVLDPAILASLQNTLTPAGLLSQQEAQRAQQEAELAERTQQATQASQAATQAYQGAAQAPVPEPSALEQFIPTLLGNTASVLTQDPSFRQRGQDEVRTQRKNLLQTRMDNLAALRDNFSRQAESAQRAGDFELEAKVRGKAESLAKQLQVMLQGKAQEHDADMEGRRAKSQADLEGLRSRSELENIRERGRQDRLTLGTKQSGGGVAGESSDNWATLVESGQAQLHNVPKEVRTAVVNTLASRDSKLLSPKVRETVNNLSAAESVLDQIDQLVADVNVSGPGLGRFVEAGKSSVRGFMQTDESDALYDKTRKGFLATISRSTGEKGVLTDRDALRAENLLPQRTDTELIANRKLQTLRMFLNGQRERTIRNFTTTAKQLSDQWKTGQWYKRDDGKVYAKRKSDGRTGWIDPEDPDINLFAPAEVKP